MKIYPAAPYPTRVEMQSLAAILRENGYEVTSTWVDGSHSVVDTPTEGDRFAREDLQDIDESDVLVFFSEAGVHNPPRGQGGRHVEFGYMLATVLKGDKYLVIYGRRENVFHYLDDPRVLQVNNMPDLFDKLNQLKGSLAVESGKSHLVNQLSHNTSSDVSIQTFGYTAKGSTNE